MPRKFEIRSKDSQLWLPHLHLIAEFCERVGALADQIQRPVQLQLVIHPEESKVYPRQPRLPYN